MSQFLRQVQRTQASTAPELAAIDVAQITDCLDEMKEADAGHSAGGNGNGHSTANSLSSLLEGLVNPGSVTQQIGESRLNNCRKVDISSNSTKLLLPQGGVGSSRVSESYKGIRTRLLRLQATEGIRSLCISSAVPNEGKTLTSANLALCCAQLSTLRVLLIDADLRTGGLSQVLGVAEGPGLSEILAGTSKYEEAIVASNECRNLFVLPAGTPPAPPPELFASPRWKEFVDWAGECFNLVVVDTTPILSVADFDLIASGCDRTLLVIRARHTLRESLERALEKLDRKKLIGTVFNGTDASEHSRYDDSYYYEGYYGRSGEQRPKGSARRSKAVAAGK